MNELKVQSKEDVSCEPGGEPPPPPPAKGDLPELLGSLMASYIRSGPIPIPAHELARIRAEIVKLNDMEMGARALLVLSAVRGTVA